jgi:hypothetical protein
MRLTCNYCKFFISSPVLSRGVRACGRTGKEMNNSDPKCDWFEPCHTFFCTNIGYWISPLACHNRTEQKVIAFSKNARCTKSCPQYRRAVNLLIILNNNGNDKPKRELKRISI